MSSQESMQILDDLLNTLDTRVSAKTPSHADAIATVINDEPRRTAVRSLHEDAAVQAFRQALTDGLIRVDTANRLLRLINEVVLRLIP